MANHSSAQSFAGQQKLLYEKVPSRIEKNAGTIAAAGAFLVISFSGEWKYWWFIPLVFTLGFLMNLLDRCREKVRVPNRLFDCGDALLVEHIAARVSERLPFSHIAVVDYEFSPLDESDRVTVKTILRLHKPGKRLAATLDFPEATPYRYSFWRVPSKHDPDYPPPDLYTELQRRLDEERKKARPSP
ncbi:MAG: hypothetical protein LBO00_01485 [Zoogloeaceae bacterium]|jgi:hypothetical protein|nr:hypothetical protein [Zoogloeaceae bacterium]